MYRRADVGVSGVILSFTECATSFRTFFSDNPRPTASVRGFKSLAYDSERTRGADPEEASRKSVTPLPGTCSLHGQFIQQGGATRRYGETKQKSRMVQIRPHKTHDPPQALNLEVQKYVLELISTNL